MASWRTRRRKLGASAHTSRWELEVSDVEEEEEEISISASPSALCTTSTYVNWLHRVL